MALQNPGVPISLNDVNVELGNLGTVTITMNDTAVRALAGITSGPISMYDFYGKSFAIEVWFGSTLSYNRFNTLYDGTAANWFEAYGPSGNIEYSLTNKPATTSNSHLIQIKQSNGGFVTSLPYYIPPYQSDNSPFLPAEYWGFRTVAYSGASGSFGNTTDQSALHRHPSGAYSDYSLPSNFTFEFFFKPDEYGDSLRSEYANGRDNKGTYYGGGWIIGSRQSSAYGFCVCIRNGTIHVRQGKIEGSPTTGDTASFSTNTSVIAASNYLTNNKWHHIFIGVQGTSVTLWIDGNRIAVGTATYSSWSWNTFFPQPPAGSFSQIRLQANNVYSVDPTYLTIVVPTTSFTPDANTHILTACGPRLKNYASTPTPVFSNYGYSYYTTVVNDSPFGKNRLGSNGLWPGSATYTGSTMFSGNKNGPLYLQNKPQILWSNWSSQLSTLGGAMNAGSGTSEDFTIEFWIKRHNTFGDGNYSWDDWIPIVFFTFNGYWYGGLFLTSGNNPQLRVYTGNGAGSYNNQTWTNANIWCQNWTHVAVSFKPAANGGMCSVYLYINGTILEYSGTIQTLVLPSYCRGSGPSLTTRTLVIGGLPQLQDATYYYNAGQTYEQVGQGMGAAFSISNLRISKTSRYSSSFTPSSYPFSADSNTTFLYHGHNNDVGIRDEKINKAISAHAARTTTYYSKSGTSSLNFSAADTVLVNNTAGGNGYYSPRYHAYNEIESLIGDYINPIQYRQFGVIQSQWGPSTTTRYKRTIFGSGTFEFSFRIPSGELSFYTSTGKTLTSTSNTAAGFPGNDSILIKNINSTLYFDPSGAVNIVGMPRNSWQWNPSRSGSETIAADTWHTVAIVQLGIEIRCYLNGIYIGRWAEQIAKENNNEYTPYPMVCLQENYAFGSMESSGQATAAATTGFRGQIDDVKISNTARYLGDNSNTISPSINTPTSNVLYLYDANTNKQATGGTIIDIRGYRYHIFQSSGVFKNAGASNITGIEIVCVGGGGGGGTAQRSGGGGGGAGGYAERTASNGGAITLNSGYSLNVFVGAGGAGSTNAASYTGSDGGVSYVTGYPNGTGGWAIAAGGGGGGGSFYPGNSSAIKNGRNGVTPASNGQAVSVVGCGGGGSAGAYNQYTPGTGGTGSYNGGDGRVYLQAWDGSGGGGGGSAGSGYNATHGTYPSVGGAAKVASIAGLFITCGAGGGGGGERQGPDYSNNGLGGWADWKLVLRGADGGLHSDPSNPYAIPAPASDAYMWGGGGGGAANWDNEGYTGGEGMHGIVIIRYPIA